MNRHRELAQMMRAAAAPPDGEVPTNGLAHWFKLDQDTGAEVLNYGSDGRPAYVQYGGTNNGTRWVLDSTLQRYVFDANDYGSALRLKLPAGIDLTSDHSTMVFHCRSVFQTLRGYLYDQSSPRRIITLNSSSESTDHEVYNGSTWMPIGPACIDTDVWRQLSVRLDNVAGTVQITDGGIAGQVDSVDFNYVSSLTSFFGHSNGNVGPAAAAKCADALIYERELSSQELASIRVAVLGG